MWSLLSNRRHTREQGITTREIGALKVASTGWNRDVPVSATGYKQQKPKLAYLSRKEVCWKNPRELTEAPESLKNKAQKPGRRREAQLQLVPQCPNYRGEDSAAVLSGQWPSQLHSATPALDAVSCTGLLLSHVPGAGTRLLRLRQDGFSTLPASLSCQIPKQSLGLL